MFVRLNPPIIYQSFIVLMIVICLALPATRVIPFPANLAGIPLFLIGAYIASSAKKQFQEKNIPIRPQDTPTVLDTDGAFRYTRNPMYVGIAIGLIGLAVLMRSYINFAFPVVFLIVMDVAFVRREEEILEDQLGDEYLAYKARIRRWI